jgi:hypothetical protein
VNTYRAVLLDSGRWAVEWSVDGIVHGLVYGTFETEDEARFCAYELALKEMREAGGAPG